MQLIRVSEVIGMPDSNLGGGGGGGGFFLCHTWELVTNDLLNV